jgi:ferredoxin
VHNFDNRSDRYVITHKELFLGHFGYTPRNIRNVITLNKEQALGNFQERLDPLDEKQAVAEAKRCMSCGQCFECDNCVVYCPQTAVKRVPKKEATTGRYVYTDYDEVHRLPHLPRRLPDRLHPDGPGRVNVRAGAIAVL